MCEDDCPPETSRFERKTSNATNIYLKDPGLNFFSSFLKQYEFDSEDETDGVFHRLKPTKILPED
jgi:hypothetical protein